MIISVGCRVNSKKATQFRIWATSILKKYLTQGYVVNKKNIAENYDKFLEAIKGVKSLLPKDKNLDNQSILELVKIFSDIWLSLAAYDKDKLEIKKITKRKVKLTANELSAAIVEFKSEDKKKRSREYFCSGKTGWQHRGNCRKCNARF